MFSKLCYTKLKWDGRDYHLSWQSWKTCLALLTLNSIVTLKYCVSTSFFLKNLWSIFTCRPTSPVLPKAPLSPFSPGSPDKQWHSIYIIIAIWIHLAIRDPLVLLLFLEVQSIRVLRLFQLFLFGPLFQSGPSFLSNLGVPSSRIALKINVLNFNWLRRIPVHLNHLVLLWFLRHLVDQLGRVFLLTPLDPLILSLMTAEDTRIFSIK